MTDETLVVSQRARDAAAREIRDRPYIHALGGQRDWGEQDALKIECGARDDHPLVQAFARFEAETLASLSSEIAPCSQKPSGNGNSSSALLTKDDAETALFQAIRSIRIGNKTDDKLILAELQKAGFWLCRLSSASLSEGEGAQPDGYVQIPTSETDAAIRAAISEERAAEITASNGTLFANEVLSVAEAADAIRMAIGARIAASLEGELLLTAREIASDTTMFERDSDHWLKGGWDDQLPRILRRVANGTLLTVQQKNALATPSESSPT